MPKQPTITVTTSGFMSADTINANFAAIQAFFDNTISRDGSTPNAMAGDLDMDGNDILNVGTMDVANLTVNQIDLSDIFVTTGIGGDINGLSLVAGDILYYDGANIVRLPVGSDGQILKVASSLPSWGTDVGEEGVTVEEDDVAVETNVTTINFITNGSGIISSPVAGQVDIDLETFVNG